jgi:hypothetical protein
MANEFQGLFQGAGVGDVRQAMEQERVGRIRQAMANTGNLGTQYTPNYAAAIAGGRQEMSEAIGGLGRAVGNEMGMEIPDDPRIQKAQQREKDKGEIMGLLAGFSDPKSPGGKKITEKEMEIGFSELMKRGYTKEAQEFLSMSQSMRKLDIDEIKAKNTGSAGATAAAKLKHRKAEDAYAKLHPKGKVHKRGTVKDANGNTFIESSWTPELAGPNAKGKMFWTSTDPNTPDLKPSGKTVLVESSQGLSATEEQEQKKDIISEKDRDARNLENLKQNNRVEQAAIKNEDDRGLEDLKQKYRKEATEFSATVQTKTKNIQDWNTDRNAFTGQQEAYQEITRKATRAKEILTTLKGSGGLKSAVLKLKNYFGYEGGDIASEGEVNAILRGLMLSEVKKLGTNPSNVDLSFIQQASADFAHGRTVNLAILENTITKGKRQLSDIGWMRDNPEATRDGFGTYQQKQFDREMAGAPEGFKLADDGSWYKAITSGPNKGKFERWGGAN